MKECTMFTEGIVNEKDDKKKEAAKIVMKVYADVKSNHSKMRLTLAFVSRWGYDEIECEDIKIFPVSNNTIMKYTREYYKKMTGKASAVDSIIPIKKTIFTHEGPTYGWEYFVIFGEVVYDIDIDRGEPGASLHLFDIEYGEPTSKVEYKRNYSHGIYESGSTIGEYLFNRKLTINELLNEYYEDKNFKEYENDSDTRYWKALYWENEDTNNPRVLVKSKYESSLYSDKEDDAPEPYITGVDYDDKLNLIYIYSKRHIQIKKCILHDNKKSKNEDMLEKYLDIAPEDDRMIEYTYDVGDVKITCIHHVDKVKTYSGYLVGEDKVATITTENYDTVIDVDYNTLDTYPSDVREFVLRHIITSINK